jgi:hydroxymethylpyrimidine/phosphomethylpyrimidine kinase
MSSSPAPVLCLSSNDPSGGTGVGADILVLAALGGHALPVITAITTQDSTGIEDILVMEDDYVSDQARFILEDVQIAAIKAGVLGSIENVAVAAEIAADYPDIPFVLDPSLRTAHEEIDDDMIQATLEILLPYSHILVCNSRMARLLVGDDEMEITECAQQLLQMGCPNVLISGVHTQDKTQAILYNHQGEVYTFERSEILTTRFHGADHTFSAAIAGGLANQLSMVESTQEALEYTWSTLLNAYRVGMGHAVPDRMFWARGNGAGGER